jgi:ArsR family transcriptional regulator
LHIDDEVNIGDLEDAEEFMAMMAAKGMNWEILAYLGTVCAIKMFPEFRAMGDASRLQLLALLAKREMCVTELTGRLSDNLPAISQRLKLLRAERLVSTRRQGKHIYYSLADNHIASLIENGLAHGSETDCTVCPPT